MEANHNHAGTGILRCIHGAKLECSYTYLQRHNGDIVVSYRFEHDDPFACCMPSLWWNFPSLEFTEAASEMGQLTLQVVDFVRRVGAKELEFRVGRARLEMDSEEPWSHIACEIVNCELPSVRESNIVLPSGIVLTGYLIPIRCGDKEVWLHAVERHCGLIEYLERNGGHAVTAILIIPIESRSDLPGAVERMQDLCSVLTLLSGNRVNWLRYSVVTQNDNVVVRAAQSAVLRPYQRTSFFECLSDSKVCCRLGKEYFVAIVERMMERFPRESARWNLVEIMNFWHEATSTDHFLEQRGMMVVICLEMLHVRFTADTGGDRIVPVRQFQRLERKVKKVIRDCFASPTGDGRNQSETLVERMIAKTRELNRPALRYGLTAMAEDLGIFAVPDSAQQNDPNGYRARVRLDPSEEERRLATPEALLASVEYAIKIRNKLTHDGHFPISPITVPDPEQRLANEMRSRQARFLERFVGAFLATILGWNQPLPAPIAMPDSIEHGRFGSSSIQDGTDRDE